MKSVFIALVLATAVGNIQAAAAQVLPSTQIRKPVVAVYELKDLAQTGNAEAFLTMVQTAVTTTNRFRVIERNFTMLSAEQNNANTGMTTTNTPGRRGGFEGADFLIYGTITQGQTDKRVDTGCKIGLGMLGLGGASCEQSSMSLLIDIRIVDSHTGQLRWAKQIRENAKGKVMVAGESRVDYMGLFQNAARRIATGLTLELYPAKVAAVQPDGTFILNFGSEVLANGDTFQVFGAQADCVKDPDTNECLTSEGAALGVISVYETAPKFSRARALSPFAQQPAVGTVVRFYEPVATPKKAGKGKR